LVVKKAIHCQGKDPFVEGGKLFINIEGGCHSLLREGSCALLRKLIVIEKGAVCWGGRTLFVEGETGFVNEGGSQQGRMLFVEDRWDVVGRKNNVFPWWEIQS
jgi:hypothetical protein